MSPGDEEAMRLSRRVRAADGGFVSLPSATVEWLLGLAIDARALAITYDAEALGTVPRFEAGPKYQTASGPEMKEREGALE